MKIAIVYDRVNKFGGAERVLLALHAIWPDAPLYTSFYDKARASWADVFHVHPSFLQYVPFARAHHELYPWLTPLAFESFSFDGYDVVISVTSAEAKNIITKPGTVHICYCLTPTRYLWSGRETYEQESGLVGKFLRSAAPTLRHWDRIGASRPDFYLAISHHVAGRIEKYYHRTVEKIIYPPVDTELFTKKSNEKGMKSGPFLCVSRLVPYKRLDILVDAFNELGWPLIIIGSGWSESALRREARGNITFIGDHLTDSKLALYYQKSRAFVFAGVEDLGLVAVEAQACGKPVICYRHSGMAETVIDGVTGVLFGSQDKASIIAALRTFDAGWYDSNSCRKNAERLSEKRFIREMKAAVEHLYQQTL